MLGIKNFQNQSKTGLITYDNPKSKISEAYRTLRTNILFSGIDKDIKVISITSPEPGEGKTTVVSNLALTMADAGQKVLLIDCDLRKPRIHKNFGLTNRKGFTNIIATEADISEAVQPALLNPNLSIMTSGPLPPNPSELIASENNKEMLAALREIYDIILIDSPPVCIVTDAAIVSTLSDGVLLVLSYGKSDVKAAKHAKSLLDKVNAPILGTVINKVPMNKNNYYYKYKY